MKTIPKFKNLKFMGKWEGDVNNPNVSCRKFIYGDLEFISIVSYRGFGCCTYRICDYDGNTIIFIFNRGLTNEMIIVICDEYIDDIDGWYCNNITDAKENIDNGLKFLMRFYDNTIN